MALIFFIPGDECTNDDPHGLRSLLTPGLTIAKPDEQPGPPRTPPYPANRTGAAAAIPPTLRGRSRVHHGGRRVSHADARGIVRHPGAALMYISKLILTSIRCFEDLTLDFGGKPGVTLIYGDNGAGKTTILRSLAMGLCDESSAAGLLRELSGRFINRAKDAPQGIIKVELQETEGPYRISTTLRNEKAFEQLSQLTQKFNKRSGKWPKLEPEGFPWEDLFASAYGAGIRVEGSEDYIEYRLIDAVYPLFVYDAHMQNPELAMRRLIRAAEEDQPDKRKKAKAGAEMLESITSLLANIIDLDEDTRIKLGAPGIQVIRRGVPVQLAELGDGYRATFTWVLDLISWWFLYRGYRRGSSATDVRGIVLIDEIEQHLHPKWQMTVLQRLTESFPKVQFIVATHSPLIAASCEGSTVYFLEKDGVERAQPFGWQPAGMYYQMGLSSLRSPAYVQQVIEPYRKLLAKRETGPLSPVDKQELERLRDKMTELHESDPIALTTEIDELRKAVQRTRSGKESNAAKKET